MQTEKDIQSGMRDSTADPATQGFARLYSIIRILYGPDGCPWDREQTPVSMREHLIEECYEVLDAIDENDPAHIQEELGDALLVVTMIAHMYERMPDSPDTLSVAGVFAGICDKLIRRHPHVFDASSHGASRTSNAALDSASVLSQWENIKQQERSSAKRVQLSQENLSMETTLAPDASIPDSVTVPDSVLDSITSGLTPLQRAVKVQKRAAKIGVDWPELEPVFDKIQEELKELLEAVSIRDHSSIEDEIGDLLFTVVNLARKLKVHPTPALNRANKKFEERFRRIERFMREDGHHGMQLELGLLDSYWEKAKSES